MRARFATIGGIGILAYAGSMLGAAETPAALARSTAQADPNGVKIEFAVNRATDVVVEVLDAKGETVRHLGAGLLGANAPEPFQANTLAQSLTWDRKDDLGKEVPAGEYAVRIGLGLKPMLKKVENFDAMALGALFGVTSLPDGGTVVAGGAYNCVPRYMVMDRDGKGVRQLYPPPADLKPEASPGLPFFQRGDGRWVPMLDEGVPGVRTHTAMAAAAGKLYLCPDNGEAPRVLDLATCGLQKPLSDPLFGWGKGKLCIRGAAASPDGKFLYLSGIEGGAYGAFTVLHAVYRLSTDGSAPAAVFFGNPAVAATNGTDAGLFTPVGLATDKDGNLYVCDNGNSRIVVLGPDGKVRRSIAIPTPIFVQVHPRTGDLYVLGGQGVRAGAKGGNDTRALGWEGRGLKISKVAASGATVATLPVPKPVDCAAYTGLALDAAREPAMLSFSSRGWAGAAKLDRFQDTGTNLVALASLPTGPRKGAGASASGYDPRYVNNTPLYPPYSDAIDFNYFADEGVPFVSLSPDARGLWADGNRYARKDWAAPGGLRRMRPDQSPLAFEALGTNVLEVAEKVGSPWHPNRGTMVDRRGHIYLRYTYANQQKQSVGGKDGAMTTGIEHHGPDGKKLSMIHLSNSTYGMGVDVRGNVYVGDKPHPPGVRVPADIEKAFNGKVPERIAVAYGCVLKFGPEGGTYVWKAGAPAGSAARVPGDLWTPPPAGLDAFDNYGRAYTADLQGAKWMWLGMSYVPIYRSCICYGNEFGVDPHGRVFVPDRVACRVAVLDANGNLIRYIGAYGNIESRGKNSPMPDPEIAFCSIRMVIPTATSRQFRVADNGNAWVSVIDLGYEKDERIALTLK